MNYDRGEEKIVLPLVMKCDDCFNVFVQNWLILAQTLTFRATYLQLALRKSSISTLAI